MFIKKNARDGSALSWSYDTSNSVKHLSYSFNREEDKKRMEKESQKKQVLDIFNDPLLRRVSKKSQNLPTYTKPPESRPCAVCFDIDGPSLTHSTIMFQLNVLLEDFDDVDIKVEAICEINRRKCLRMHQQLTLNHCV